MSAVRRVFLSYTGRDLAALAEVAREVVAADEAFTAVDHHHWVATGRPSVTACMEAVLRSDVLVVLVAHRYGWIPTVQEGGDGRASITWLEVRRALDAGIPVLPFVVPDDVPTPGLSPEEAAAPGVDERTDPDRRDLLAAFRAELMGRIATSVHDAAGLRFALLKALKELPEADSLAQLSGDPRLKVLRRATLARCGAVGLPDGGARARAEVWRPRTLRWLTDGGGEGDLEALFLSREDHRGVVISGPRGAGLSAALDHLAALAADPVQGPARLGLPVQVTPIRLDLAQVVAAGRRDDPFGGALEVVQRALDVRPDDVEVLRHEPQVLWLVDGLGEVPSLADRDALVGAIARQLRVAVGHRVVLAASADALTGVRRPEGLAVAALAPLDAAARSALAASWDADVGWLARLVQTRDAALEASLGLPGVLGAAWRIRDALDRAPAPDAALLDALSGVGGEAQGSDVLPQPSQAVEALEAWSTGEAVGGPDPVAITPLHGRDLAARAVVRHRLAGALLADLDGTADGRGVLRLAVSRGDARFRRGVIARVCATGLAVREPDLLAGLVARLDATDLRVVLDLVRDVSTSPPLRWALVEAWVGRSEPEVLAFAGALAAGGVPGDASTAVRAGRVLGRAGCPPPRAPGDAVAVPAGRHRVGSASGRADEAPEREVTLGPFLLARCPTTVRQWREFCARTGRAALIGGDDEAPMAGVSWHEADAYCRWVGGHLPTEAQWEAAARAGVSTWFPDGDDESDLRRVAWTRADGLGRPQPVGSKPANRAGLHDALGNVWEWCADTHGPYRAEDLVDPVGALSGTSRVLRGGSFRSAPVDARLTSRRAAPPTVRPDDVGFRVAWVAW